MAWPWNAGDPRAVAVKDLSSDMASKLSLYQRKRDFTKTAEPSGAGKVAAAEYPRFVIQKHAATRLHYDLRLELDGVSVCAAAAMAASGRARCDGGRGVRARTVAARARHSVARRHAAARHSGARQSGDGARAAPAARRHRFGAGRPYAIPDHQRAAAAGRDRAQGAQGRPRILG